MENDNKKLLEENIDIVDGEGIKLFRFEYANQNIKKNKEFQNWKLQLIKKYGKTLLLYKCNKDRIYFYNTKANFEYYEDNCPECKQSICCFCSQIVDGPHIFSRYIRNFCCLKRTIHFIFFREQFDDNDYPAIAFLAFIIFIIPFFNNFGIILCIIQNLFCLRKPRNYNHYCIHNYYYQRKALVPYNCIKIISLGFSLCMGICFINFTIIYTLLLLLLSIPFKLRPLNNLIFFVSENAGYSKSDCCLLFV